MPESNSASSERWIKIKDVFQQAIDRDHADRCAFLEGCCANDPQLRAEVESLLSEHDGASRFLEGPGIEAFVGQAFLLEGRSIGPYRILEKIGQGGMGAVYLASRADDFQQRVAIKVVTPGLDVADIVDRFRRERQTLANLDHPGIAKLLDGGAADDGRPYFVMEYVDGVPIDDYCDTHGLASVERLRLFRVVCSAVHYAHQNLVVHRDIKPDNILVGGDGAPKLVDFGIAKLLTPTGAPLTIDLTRGRGGLMTPEYASPEQVRAEPISTASDVYSLGVLLYRLLTGVLPYRLDRRTIDEITRAVCDQDPERPSSAVARTQSGPGGETSWKSLQRQLAGDLDAILLKALRKEPASRYGSVEQFSEDIRRYLEGLPVLAQRDRFTYRARKFVRRHRGSVATGVVTLMVLLASVALTAWHARVAAIERDRARTSAATADQINAFLRGMLGSADPYTDGKDVTVAQTLGQAARRIDSTLSAQPEVAAAVRSTIGNTYVNLGLTDDAEPMLRRALADRQRLFGKDHSDVAASLGDLAYLLFEKGDIGAAEPLYRQSLEIYRRLGHEENFNTVTVLNGLGRVEHAKGNDAAAEAYYRNAYTIARRLPEGDRVIAESLNNLAVVRQSHGDLQEAETLFREALGIIGRLRGPESPEMATGLSNLSGVLSSKGDLAGAEEVSATALAMRRKVLGHDHPDVAFALFNHAELLDRLGRPEEAIHLSQELLSLRGNSIPDEHPIVPAALLVMGRSHTQQGHLVAGERYLREALALRRKILPPGHWLISSTESTLGGCLTAQGRYREAERLLTGGYERLKADRGERHERTMDARARLVTLYEAWQRPELAVRYRVTHPGVRR